MLKAALAGLLVFAATAAALRTAEWLYHRLRRTADWSPHWGAWAFAILAGLWSLVANLGR